MITPKSVIRQSFSVFFVLSFFAITLLEWTNVFANAGIDGRVVLSGDVIIFFVTAFSFRLSERSLGSPNPNASVRSLYGSFMLKFFVLIIAAFIYIMIEKKNVNKPALFICMGLYLVYTFLEVASLQKLLKQKKNA
jgi:hypothetical protein